MTQDLQAAVASVPWWYHKIELPGGITTPGWAPMQPERYNLPADLTGKRVLDVGAWDGYWTFECLRRGAAEVVAIDDFSDACGLDKLQEQRRKLEWRPFDICRDALGYTATRCKRIKMSVYEVTKAALGEFDLVLFFGVLYHLRHPQMAMDLLYGVTKPGGMILVETAICDDVSTYVKGPSGLGTHGPTSQFHPTNEYGNNPSNWEVPNLQCVGARLLAAGYSDIQLGKLTETATSPVEARGFAAAVKPMPQAGLKVSAAMSVPRLGFMDNFFCVFESLLPLGIPIRKTTGAFWGQCLERAMEDAIESGVDAILTIDYDSVFRKEDVQALISLMVRHPEADAIAALQMGREAMPPLISMRDANGQPRYEVDGHEFSGELLPVHTAHFGLTLIRASSVKKMAHPWFIGKPNANGQWRDGRIDDDIVFWKAFEAAGNKLFLAPRVPIGHAELKITWPDKTLQPLYQGTTDYWTNGRAAGVWE